ncbi:MAG TPA: trypsin-like peptidase domain-containing protein [Steroidobacteraceae bacterium]|nr:trypsin-like peptidase domain-containing protein [Steroidobacteraceae bacterium]
MTAFSRVLVFLLRFAVVGLAAAFVLVLLKPDLLRPQASSGEPVAAPPTTAPGRQTTSYAEAVERSAPAVVNINTERVVTERALPPQLERLFGPRYRQRIERSLGSGVVIDGEGHIVTNNHVVPEAAAISVQISDGRVAPAQVLGRDPDTDLAVLKVDLPDLPTMTLGRSDRLRSGDVVLAIGNPVGLSQTVTQGIVSATGRGLYGMVADFENFIQTDAAINAGNSGGALVNTSGELVGINTAVLARTAGIEGISFAIPVDLVRGVTQEILRNGRVVRGWIGVECDDLSPQLAQALGVQDGSGVLVAVVRPDSQAERAGLRRFDVITHMDDEQIQTSVQARAHVARLLPGKEVQVRGIRRGQAFEFTIPISERPQQ